MLSEGHMAWTWGQPQRAEDNPSWLHKNRDIGHKELNSSNYLDELGRAPQAPDENTAQSTPWFQLGETLNKGLGVAVPGHLAQGNWDKKSVLF